MKITITPNPNHGTLPASDKLGFGSVFTDHMFLMDYTEKDGWHNARIVPFGLITASCAKQPTASENASASAKSSDAIRLMRFIENSSVSYCSYCVSWTHTQTILFRCP